VCVCVCVRYYYCCPLLLESMDVGGSAEVSVRSNFNALALWVAQAKTVNGKVCVCMYVCVCM